MTQTPLTSVCIVSYNCATVLGDCLRSIPPQYPVYVIDNASKDGSLAVIRSVRPEAIIIDNNENLGFGRGHNRLLQHVKTPFALLLNPDAILLPKAIQNLENTAAAHPKAAIIGGMHVDENGLEEPCFKPFHRGLFDARKVDMVSGAMMLLRMDAFDGKFFDDNIFLYFEDDDICFQAKQKGWDVYIEPAARLRHSVGHSSGTSLRGMWTRSFHYAWSHAYTQNKNGNFGPHKGKKFARRVIATSTKRLVKSALTFRPVRAARFWGEICGYRAYMKQRSN